MEAPSAIGVHGQQKGMYGSTQDVEQHVEKKNSSADADHQQRRPAIEEPSSTPTADAISSYAATDAKNRRKSTIVESVVHPSIAVKESGQLGPNCFEKLKLLGRGDVAHVYLVRMRDTNRLYAMKILSKEDMIRRNKVKRVLTEREILTTTDHPFIVSLYATFQSTERLYYVMEYCAGGELYHFLQSQPHHRLPEHVVRFYAAEVLLALEYLHMKGFIYRDLKPENILIHESGHIRLADFDLSKQTSSPLNPKVVQGTFFHNLRHSKIETRQVQQFHSFVGTEEYIAPEVITGQGHSATVDWWTFGILLYEMLFGKTPFKGSAQTETFQNIVESRETLHIPVEPHISRHCKDLIKKLLAHDPKKRLGHKRGAADIKSHPWFKGVKWALVRNETPPMVPKLTSPLDTSYFHPISKDNEVLGEEDNMNQMTEDQQHLETSPFGEFRFVAGVHRYGEERRPSTLSSASTCSSTGSSERHASKPTLEMK